MFNATIVGNLGKEPNVREFNGTAVVDFSLASNRFVKGEAVTTWVKVTIWGKMATVCAERLKKGNKVAVTTSRIKAEAWVAEDGEARGQIAVTADKIQFLSPKPEGSAAAADDEMDDIPF